jgi:hypothetical protein
MVAKLVDPIVQSLLIILFVLTLDTDFDFSPRRALYMIIGWQILSAVVNFILNVPTQLRRERIVYLVTIVLYMPLFFYLERHVNEIWITVRHGDDPTIPVYRIIFESVAIVISFWYYVICFREIRTMMGSTYTGD